MPARSKFTVEQMRQAYEKYGSIGRAATALGIHASSLHERLKKSGFSGFKSPRLVTAADRAAVREYYESGDIDRLGLKPICARFDRTRSDVAEIAASMGLTNRSRGGRVEPASSRSMRTKAWLATNKHPRGFWGRSHADEVKVAQSARAKRTWASVTTEELASMAAKRHATNIAKYGTPGPATLKVTNAYSRARRGRREDLGGQYFRSKWEANYARYLNWLASQDEILSWAYEPTTFVFKGVTRGVLSYTPDFLVTSRKGSAFHEVKGWMDAKSKAKLKRMQEFYPDVAIVVIGEAEYKDISKWSGMIPGWE
jgi:hypothetical protein